jgi:hypothetical protein
LRTSKRGRMNSWNLGKSEAFTATKPIVMRSFVEKGQAG